MVEFQFVLMGFGNEDYRKGGTSGFFSPYVTICTSGGFF